MSFPVTDDALHLMATEARDLLRRVDLVIDHLGVPDGHRLAALLRSLRVRPGEALDLLLATPPGPLVTTARELRRLADAYHQDLADPLRRATEALGWGGAGYQAFAAQWDAQLGRLSGDMASRLRATGDFVESVAGWFSHGRQAMAAALVEAFGSTEAILLKCCGELEHGPRALHRAAVTGDLDTGVVPAAARIGAVVLTAVSEWYEAGVTSFVAGPDGVPAGGWPDRLAELPELSAPAGDAHHTPTLWVRI